MFLWLAIQNKCWTADRLAHRGLPHPYQSVLCDQEEETIQHILTTCIFTRQFWHSLLILAGLSHIAPWRNELSFADWGIKASQQVDKKVDKTWRKGFNSMVLLGSWTLWNHRNNCVVNGASPSIANARLYYHGCAAASSALRVAKEIAAKNRGARVLVACAELSLVFFRTPDESHHDTLVMQALFGDGGGAVIVGSDPETSTERPLFDMVSAAQTVVPKTKHSVSLKLSKNGMDYHLSNELPVLVAHNMEKCMPG